MDKLLKEGADMDNVQNVSPVTSKRHVEIIDGARYEVTSNYVGEITFLDLLKQMLKRDLAREELE